jgi:mycothiol system anti-sigma-R factor
MECREVIERLWEYLDDELAAKEAAAVDGHLAGCPFCRPRCRHDRAFLLLIARSLSAECSAPPGLKEAIRTRLAVTHPDR